ncbi:hypothetical protein ACH4TY_24895 [Streptomyces anulatus]
MPVVTPNIARGRRLLLTLFVLACLVTLVGLLAWGWVLLDDQVTEALR